MTGGLGTAGLWITVFSWDPKITGDLLGFGKCVEPCRAP